MSNLKALLLEAPDTQLDKCMKPLIEKWNEEPTALQILEVLDQCVHASLASGFVITLFQNLLDAAMKRESITLDELVIFATWRNNT